jgi:hypothetical protein
MKLKAIFLLLWISIPVLFSQNLTGVKICINPGHGGYDSDDRNVVIAPYKSGDPNGFWESKSNLDKGFALREMLEAAGATVIMTRTQNRTEDDLPLSQIVAMANQANVDFMLSIHSNAGNGVANHVLMIHVGVDPTDSQVYNTFNPGNPVHKDLSDRSRDISTEIAKNIYGNQITTWSSNYSVRGDKTFARLAMGWSDGYGVLRALYVPGVISEGAMHDYIPETYRLMNMEYKWLEAWYFFKSFTNYFKGGNIPTGVIAGSVRDSRIKLESTYNKFKGRDEMLPLNGAKLTLIETGQEYTVDNMQNGVFLFKNLTPGVYHVKAEISGHYPQTQQITVSAHNVSFFNFALNRVRNTPPQIIAWSPNVAITDSVEASTSILFEFNWDMDEASTAAAFSITPHVTGKITFEDTQYKMRFTPDIPFEKATVYTVKLAKTASHPDNLSMTNDFEFSFLTKNRNRLALLSSYPNTEHPRMHYVSPTFRLIFDRRLNTTNLATTIRVVDEQGNVVSKVIRSVVNNQVALPHGSHYFKVVDNLVPGKNYFLQVDGIVFDEIGMKVVEPVNIPFTAVDALISKPLVKHDFETVALQYQAAKSISTTNGIVSINTGTRLAGNASNRLNAGFSADNAHAVYMFSEPFSTNTEKIVGMHVHGDLSDNILQIMYRDGADTAFVNLCKLRFIGWEFHEVDMNALSGIKTLEILGLRVVRSNPLSWGNSLDIYLDNLMVYSIPILSVPETDAAIRVYPNPARGMVWVSGTQSDEPLLQLYNMNGSLLRTVKSREMNLGDLPAGMYLLSVEGRQQLIVNSK